MAKKKYTARKAGVGAAIAGAGASIGAGVGNFIASRPESVQGKTSVADVYGGASRVVPVAHDVAQSAAHILHGTAAGAVIGTAAGIGAGLYGHYLLRREQFGNKNSF